MLRLWTKARAGSIECPFNEVWRQFVQARRVKARFPCAREHGLVDIGGNNR
jgi:hypothetical protein